MFVALSGAAIAQQKVTLTLGHLAYEQNPWHLASVKFAEEVSKRTNGEAQIKVFPNEQLGKETDLIKGIQLGTVDLILKNGSCSPLPRIFEAAAQPICVTAGVMPGPSIVVAHAVGAPEARIGRRGPGCAPIAGCRSTAPQ